jgi:hypothetical protein
MHNLKQEITDKDMDKFCNKIEFLFCCLAIHTGQINTITERYINNLDNIDSQEISEKQQFFDLIQVKADLIECILTLRGELSNEMMKLNEDKIDYYRHYLVTKVAKNMKESKRWSRLLLMYSSTREDKFIKVWYESMKRFEQLSYLPS